MIWAMFGYGRIPIVCEAKSLAGFNKGLYICVDSENIHSYIKQHKN